MAEFQIAKKSLSWTLKFEGDAIKVPDIKSPAVIKIKTTLEGTVDIVPSRTCKDPTWTIIPLNDVPADQTIVAVVLKLEGTVPKDFIPLRVYTATPPTKDKDGKDVPNDNFKELPDRNQTPAIVFFKLLEIIPPIMATPTPKDTIYVVNDNDTPAKLSVQIAFK